MPDQITPPLVTIAMPIYNAGGYLRLAVTSILRQTFQNWELLIIDDGSTDGALDTIKDICDQRVLVFGDGANKGLAARLNQAIDMARGRYFARMDQDDVSYPERIERQVACMEINPQIDLLGTRAITIDEDNVITGKLPFRLTHRQICAHPWIGFYLPHPTWLGRIEWFRKHRYSEPAPYLCEDQELLLRSYSESRFETLNEVLFAYRVRSNVILSKLSRTRASVRRMQSHHFSVRGEILSFSLVQIAYTARVILDRITSKFRLRNFWDRKTDTTTHKKWKAVLSHMES